MLDDKFNDMAMRQFEDAAPGIHEYMMINATLPVRYVKNSGIHNITEQEFLLELSRNDVAAVMFHSLPIDRYRLLASIPDGIKVFWFGWGYDYYPLLKNEFPNGLVMPRTAKISRPKYTKRLIYAIRSRVKRSLQSAGLRPAPAITDILALQRIDYFSPVLDVEYHLVCKHYAWFTAKYICWNYGTVEDDFSLPGLIGGATGKNILLGNSAAHENNHIEIIDAIKNQLDLSEIKVIVPLSYGDNKYRDEVIRYGKKVLGENFVPLIDFMPYDQYIQTLSSCGFVMMNHLRQQALGNICISILLGAKIFLHPINPLYNWLKAKGVVLGNIEELDDSPLTEEERDTNIKAIRAHWGREAQREKTRRVVEVALA